MRTRCSKLRNLDFRFLSPTQIDLISKNALILLEENGVAYPSDQALRCFRSAGCRTKGEKVYIPIRLIDQIVRALDSTIRVANHAGNVIARAGAGTTCFGAGLGSHVVDLRGEVERAATPSDIVDVVRITDYLPHFAFLSMQATPAYDIGSLIKHALQNTRKSIVVKIGNEQEVRALLDIHSRLSSLLPQYSDFPFLLAAIESTEQPFAQGMSIVEMLIRLAEAGIPIVFHPSAQIARISDSPVYDCVLTSTVETLANLCLAALVNRKARFVAGESTFSGASSKAEIVAAAQREIARAHRLPFLYRCTTTGKSETSHFGELAFKCCLATIGGYDFVSNVGTLGQASAVSLESLVISNEMFDLVNKSRQVFEISEETVALDVIDAVGPLSGGFLTTDHTIANYRSVVWDTEIFDKRNHHQWVQAGGLSMIERARTKIEEILASHQCSGLTDAESSQVCGRS